jgi:T5SS/PEP-CTERM-associated repeat protein
MNSKSFLSVLAIILFSGLLLIPSASAQYISANQTNIISGVVSNWSGDYTVGPWMYDALFITDAGALSDDNGHLSGPAGGSDTGAVVVTGIGSTWNNSGDLTIGSDQRYDQLTITNGGVVYDNNGFTGTDSSYSSGASVIVTGSGSVWSNRSDLFVRGQTFTIADGGTVFNSNAAIGADSGGRAVITGTGSAWYINGTLGLSSGSGGSMVITDGGVVRSGSADFAGQGFSVAVTGTGSVWIIDGDLDCRWFSANLSITNGGVVSVSGSATLTYYCTFTVSGGSLSVTNGLGTSVVAVNVGTLAINSGTVTVDQLVTTDRHYGGIVFNGGVLRSKATTIIGNSANSAFAVGNGTDAATFILDTGGSSFHSFAKGLTISSNGALRGIGTIIGSTMVNDGGLLAPGMSPGSITFSNSLTLAPNSTFAVELDGHNEGQYDRIVALDTVTLSNSILSVSLGFTPSIGDSFTIISNLSAVAVLGTFVTSDGAALPNGTEFATDGTTFQIDYTANTDGQDVTLTAVIPEPSSLLLATFGALLVCPLFKRRRK